MIDTPKDPQVAQYIEGMRAWRAEFEAVRPVLLRAGLEEEFKWYKPCYTHGGSNVVIFQPFKELCALLFFKGALLHDPDGALRSKARTPAPRCAWSSAPSQMSRPRRGPSPRSCRTPSASSRPGCRFPSALLQTTGPTPRSSACCSTPMASCATRGSA